MKHALLLLLLFPAAVAAEPRPWPTGDVDGSIASRLSPPAGFTRGALPKASFGAWLRALPLRPGRPPVHLFDGRLKGNQEAHHAVVAIDVGPKDLQQCADAVMRLRAEWQRASGREDELCFRFTSGDAVAWTRWRDGERPRVGSTVTWARGEPKDASYAGFRRWLDEVFNYAGTTSMAHDTPRADLRSLAPGDVFVHGGFPGHAEIVLDVATDARGAKAFLLGQSYMPAQEIQVLRNPATPGRPWYLATADGALVTPEWTFAWSELHRFRDGACARR